MMNNVNNHRRLPAEWENSKAILLSWPHEETDWAPMLNEVSECFVRIATAVVEEMWLVVVASDIEVPKQWLKSLDSNRIIYCQIPTNDTWARDFGPITVFEESQPKICDFKFNGWGLKFASNFDNLITKNLYELGVLKGELENRLGFALEGGSIDSDGCGTVLTTSECLLSLNRNGDKSQKQIEDYLKEAFGANRILWLNHGYLAGDDTDSHIDTLARFASPDTILYVKCDDPNDEHYQELSLMEQELKSFVTAEGLPYHLIGLPMAAPAYDEDNQRLPATYANFLITPESVLMPTYGSPVLDTLAAQMLQMAFPGRTIKPIDCQALIRQHGSLHCVTMQLPSEILSI